MQDRPIVGEHLSLFRQPRVLIKLFLFFWPLSNESASGCVRANLQGNGGISKLKEANVWLSNVQQDIGLQLIFHVDDIGMLKLFCLRGLTISPTGRPVSHQSMYVAASGR